MEVDQLHIGRYLDLKRGGAAGVGVEGEHAGMDCGDGSLQFGTGAHRVGRDAVAMLTWQKTGAGPGIQPCKPV